MCLNGRMEWKHFSIWTTGTILSYRTRLNEERLEVRLSFYLFILIPDSNTSSSAGRSEGTARILERVVDLLQERVDILLEHAGRIQ